MGLVAASTDVLALRVVVMLVNVIFLIADGPILGAQDSSSSLLVGALRNAAQHIIETCTSPTGLAEEKRRRID